MEWNVVITDPCIGPRGATCHRGQILKDVSEKVAGGIISAGRGLIAESEAGKKFLDSIKAEQALKTKPKE